VVRETVVIVLRDDAMTEGERWAAAYSAESTWLLEDLSNRAFPQLDAIVAG
jgi:hypothetical protein